MGGFFPVFEISVSNKPFALTGFDSVLIPEDKKYIVSIVHTIISQRGDTSGPSGEVTIREVSFEEGRAYEAAIMDHSIDEKWAKLREQIATTDARDWKGLESLDWVLLE